MKLSDKAKAWLTSDDPFPDSILLPSGGCNRARKRIALATLTPSLLCSVSVAATDVDERCSRGANDNETPSTAAEGTAPLTTRRVWTIASVKKLIRKCSNVSEDGEDLEAVTPKQVAVDDSKLQSKKRKRESIKRRRMDTKKRRSMLKYEIVKILDRRWNQEKVGVV